MFEQIYPWVTFFLILSSLFQALLIPLGAASGLLTLIILTLFKIVLAKAAAPIKNVVDNAGGMGKEAAQLAKGAKSLNIYALIIDYLFTQMNQAEQIFLIIGWALFPVAAAGFLAIYLGGIAGIICNAAWVDWCKLIKPIVDIFK
ncbi:MAG: hypothetical protein HZC05_01025 [Candidatus Magasanikbacteria bacterium]|nr:hypothetical protein [Candidatus Magasanikbacteria bacterium]